MRKRFMLPKFQPATLISILALFVAVGGTATAASGLLNGKNIKNGTITGKKLKRGTVTKAKIAPSTRKALKGKAGPRGIAGPAGANGVIQPLSSSSPPVNLAANSNVDVVVMDVPSRRYLVTAVTGLASNGTGTITCSLSTNNEAGASSGIWRSPEALYQAALPLQLLTTKATTKITLNCSTGPTAGAASGSIVATPVG